MSQTGSHPTTVDNLPKQTGKTGPLVPNSIVGMLIFVMTEAMFFAALFSAHTIVSAGADNWPPLGQPRLPVASTAFNTLFLLLSGWTIFRANRHFAAQPPRLDSTRRLLLTTILLGGFFVLFQGFEWIRLLQYGLTMVSSSYGSFFYLLIGTHAVHAIAALIALIVVYSQLRRGRMRKERFWGAQVFWYFVVGVWPVLYVIVYLN